MKKIIFLILVLVLISISACQQAAKETVMEKKEGVMEKTEPKVEATGNAAVDAVGNDINNVNNVEKDLSTDELGDLDAGLSDVQNI